MKIKSIIALLLLSSTTVMAQETKPVSLQVEARADYQRINIDGKKIKEGSGFKGNVVNIILKGDLPQPSERYQQGLQLLQLYRLVVLEV